MGAVNAFGLLAKFEVARLLPTDGLCHFSKQAAVGRSAFYAGDSQHILGGRISVHHLLEYAAIWYFCRRSAFASHRQNCVGTEKHFSLHGCRAVFCIFIFSMLAPFVQQMSSWDSRIMHPDVT